MDTIIDHLLTSRIDLATLKYRVISEHLGTGLGVTMGLHQ